MKPARGLTWRLWSIQGSFAPDARQWLGWIAALEAIPSPDRAAPDWVDREPRAVNTNPHLIGLLVGARVGIEERVEGPDGRTMARTVTEVLPSTLGALGDRLVWTGIRPALVAVAAALAPWAGGLAALVAWLLFAGAQAWFRSWSFAWARRQGPRVAVALNSLPWHPITEAARLVGAIGVGVVTASLSTGTQGGDLPIAGAAAGFGAFAAWRRIDPLWALLGVVVIVAGGTWVTSAG